MSRLQLPGRLALLAFVTLVTGCGAGNADALGKEVTALRGEVTRLQNQTDRLEERLAAVEVTRRTATAARPGPAETGEERPALQVVRLEPGAAEPGPSGDEVDAPVDDAAPRPVIRLEGGKSKRPFDGVRVARPEEDR